MLPPNPPHWQAPADPAWWAAQLDRLEDAARWLAGKGWRLLRESAARTLLGEDDMRAAAALG